MRRRSRGRGDITNIDTHYHRPNGQPIFLTSWTRLPHSTLETIHTFKGAWRHPKIMEYLWRNHYMMHRGKIVHGYKH